MVVDGAPHCSPAFFRRYASNPRLDTHSAMRRRGAMAIFLWLTPRAAGIFRAPCTARAAAAGRRAESPQDSWMEPTSAGGGLAHEPEDMSTPFLKFCA